MCHWLIYCTEYILPYTSILYSAEQISGGGGCVGVGVCIFCLPFQPLCSLTPIQFYILPARLTHAHTEKHALTQLLLYTPSHMQADELGAYLHPHNYTHAHTHTRLKKQLFLCYFFWLDCNNGVSPVNPNVCDWVTDWLSGDLTSSLTLASCATMCHHFLYLL